MPEKNRFAFSVQTPQSAGVKTVNMFFRPHGESVIRCLKGCHGCVFKVLSGSKFSCANCGHIFDLALVQEFYWEEAK